jgi:predicted RNase H-like nuclease (RuvC/YqgF family)
MIQDLFFVLFYIGENMKEYINEKMFLLSNICCIVFFVAIIIFGISLSKSRGTIEQYRIREQEFERELAEQKQTIDDARQSVAAITDGAAKSSESLQRQFNSIQELRAVLREIEENYKCLENDLDRLRTVLDNNSNSSNSNEVKE